MMRRNNKRVLLTTLLVIGEGAADEAFLKHLKSIYHVRFSDKKIKIESGDGGSPGVIITNSIRTYRYDEYDCKYLFLDSDLPIDPEQSRDAEANGFEVILWKPNCLEGALLETLGKRVNNGCTSQQLKDRLHPLLNGSATSSASYSLLFTKDTIEQGLNNSVNKAKLIFSND